jgi:hypothetical protein
VNSLSVNRLLQELAITVTHPSGESGASKTVWRRELDLNLQDPSFNWLSMSQEALELSGREQ